MISRSWQVWETLALREPRNRLYHLSKITKLRRQPWSQSPAPPSAPSHYPTPNDAQSRLRPVSHTGKAAAPAQTRYSGRGNHPTCLLVINPDDVREAVVAVWNMTVLERLLPSFSPPPPPLNDSQISTSCFGGTGEHISHQDRLSFGFSFCLT